MTAIEPEEHRRARLAARAAVYTSRVAHLRALRDETAGELCTHRMPLTNCTDCRKRTDAETTTTEEHADA